MRSTLVILLEALSDSLLGRNVENIDTDSESESGKVYRKLKARLQEVEKKKKSKPTYLFIVIFFVLLAILAYYILLTEHTIPSFSILGVAIAVIIGILAGCAGSIYLYMLLETREIHLRSRIFEYEFDDAQDKVEDDVFENSIKMSYKYLDQYYLQTREQAQRGFFVTVCVAVFGAMLIFAGIVAMFFGKVEPSYVTCASGVITEFIAAIFFYLYNRTVSSMSRYHNKLVLSQNISIALKVSDSLPPEDSAKTKNLIVTELLKDINVHLVKDDSSAESSK